MLDQFKILRVRSRDALDVNVWKLVAKLIGITYKSRMPKSDLQTKSCTSPNLSRLITPKVSHEKFLRMSDYRASSNPRFVLFCFVFFFFYNNTPQSKAVTVKKKLRKFFFLACPSWRRHLSALTRTFVRADASIASVSRLLFCLVPACTPQCPNEYYKSCKIYNSPTPMPHGRV